MAELFCEKDRRTHYCGEVDEALVGERVTVLGWVQRQRDLGALIFIDLRDRSGIVQLAFDENTEKEIFDKAFSVRAEFVLCAKGVVRERATINKNIPTGDIEIVVDEFKILNSFLNTTHTTWHFLTWFNTSWVDRTH